MVASKRNKVSVIGLGFVGSAMCVAIASAKDKNNKLFFDVVGIDQKNLKGKQVIKSLNNGIFPIPTKDKKIVSLTQKVHKQNNFHCSSDYKDIRGSKIVIIDINLDLKNFNINNPDIDFFSYKNSIKKIIEYINTETLIIIQTTVPPGTTKKIIKPIIEKYFYKKNMKFKFLNIAFSFERVMPGKDYLNSIINNWRVVGADNPKSANQALNFFRKFINAKKYPITILESTQAAEFTKILENSYRAANIAFIEEWSRLAENIGIDIYKVIETIKLRKTHINIAKPGFGVGGYCLTKDPLFGKISAKKIYRLNDLKFPISSKSILINRNSPNETIKLLKKNVTNLEKETIGIFGLSYKADVGDVRFSPTLFLTEYLIKNKIKFFVHDPFFNTYEKFINKNTSNFPDPRICSVLIFCVPHKEYKEINFKKYLKFNKPVILDAFNVLNEKQIMQIKKNKIKFLSIGR